MIVIADDDPLYDADLKAILSYEGFPNVRVVKTCKEIFDIIDESGLPKAIVLDMMLPLDSADTGGGLPPEQAEDLRGLGVARKLKEMKFDSRRVIVITAFHSQRANDLLRELGIGEANILLKPARTREIVMRIRTAYTM